MVTVQRYSLINDIMSLPCWTDFTLEYNGLEYWTDIFDMLCLVKLIRDHQRELIVRGALLCISAIEQVVECFCLFYNNHLIIGYKFPDGFSLANFFIKFVTVYIL